VAEAPPGGKPGERERYFYLEDVRKHDDLFRSVVRGVLGDEPSRVGKKELLSRLRDEGVFLIDLKRDPLDGSALRGYVPDLLRRCKALSPRKIILIDVDVYDVAYLDMREAGLPIVDERIPFPGSGQQKRFKEAFARALKKKVQKPGRW
jgi:hypothetical protein